MGTGHMGYEPSGVEYVRDSEATMCRYAGMGSCKTKICPVEESQKCMARKFYDAHGVDYLTRRLQNFVNVTFPNRHGDTTKLSIPKRR